MEPADLSARLLQLASYVSKSPRPSVSFLRRSLAAVLLATDRSMAESVAKALAGQVAELMPTEFDGETYDTSVRGKGYKGGYVSWAMKPNTWQSEDLIGGVLFGCKYDASEFSSEAPDDGADWQGHSKGEALLTLQVSAAYYNKKLGGGVDERVDLGTCTVHLDAKENVVEADIDDPAAFKSGLQGLIKQVADSPPDEALSQGLKKKRLPPTVSIPALYKWLLQNQRTEVNRSEINALVKNMSEARDRAPGTVLEEVNSFFKKRGMPIDEAA